MIIQPFNRIGPGAWLATYLLQRVSPFFWRPPRKLFFAGRFVTNPAEVRVPTRHGLVRALVYQPEMLHLAPDISSDPFYRFLERTNMFWQTWGDGWHNNHHAFPASARHGLRWFELDPTWLGICLLGALGLARDVRLPTSAALARGREAGQTAPTL